MRLDRSARTPHLSPTLLLRPSNLHQSIWQDIRSLRRAAVHLVLYLSSANMSELRGLAHNSVAFTLIMVHYFKREFESML